MNKPEIILDVVCEHFGVERCRVQPRKATCVRDAANHLMFDWGVRPHIIAKHLGGKQRTLGEGRKRFIDNCTPEELLLLHRKTLRALTEALDAGH